MDTTRMVIIGSLVAAVALAAPDGGVEPAVPPSVARLAADAGALPPAPASASREELKEIREELRGLRGDLERTRTEREQRRQTSATSVQLRDRAVEQLLALDAQLTTGNIEGAEQVLQAAEASLDAVGRGSAAAARAALANKDLNAARVYLAQAIQAARQAR